MTCKEVLEDGVQPFQQMRSQKLLEEIPKGLDLNIQQSMWPEEVCAILRCCTDRNFETRGGAGDILEMWEAVREMQAGTPRLKVPSSYDKFSGAKSPDMEKRTTYTNSI